MSYSDAALQKQLDLAAKHINKAASMLRAAHGPKAYLYFEAEGSVYAMRYDPDDLDKSSFERQENIVCSSRCEFDCGAW